MFDPDPIELKQKIVRVMASSAAKLAHASDGVGKTAAGGLSSAGPDHVFHNYSPCSSGAEAGQTK